MFVMLGIKLTLDYILVFTVYHLSIVVTLNFLHISIIMIYLHGILEKMILMWLCSMY